MRSEYPTDRGGKRAREADEESSALNAVAKQSSMFRRQGRDSDSRRRHSRFDREPSPKRSRRDEKQERDRDRNRVISSANHENGIGNRSDRDQRHHQQPHVALPPEAPLAHDPKQEQRAANKDTDKKPSHYNEAPKRPSNPTEVPRSSSYFQHDERNSTGQVGRSSGRMATGERGWWKDSREELNGKETSHRREQRDEKSQAKPDNITSLRRDVHSERRDDLPPQTTKKRPAFREKKIPVDHEDAKPVATETVKSSQTDHPQERNERREERSHNPRHSDRYDKQQYGGDRAPRRNEARRDGFSSSRGRYNNNYGARERFHGREDFRFSNTVADKWKHDLYQEVNKDPTPKNEDDQIAKVEALLAS